MKFFVQWSVSPNNRGAVQSRFIETGGLPPEEVKMLHRYHAVDGSMGFALCETNDEKALARWSQDWTDLLAMEIIPIINDEEMGSVLSV